MMKVCSSCNMLNDDGRKACYQCNKPLIAPNDLGTALSPSPLHAESSLREDISRLIKRTWAEVVRPVIVSRTVGGIYWWFIGIFIAIAAAVTYSWIIPWTAKQLRENHPPAIVEILWDKKPVPPGTKVILTAVTRDDSMNALDFKWKSSAKWACLLKREDRDKYGDYQIEVEAPQNIPSNTQVDVDLIVNDGRQDSEKEIVHIFVLPKKEFNTAPILTPIYSCTGGVIRPGERAELSVNAFDKDGDQLEITWYCAYPVVKITPYGEKKEKAFIEIPKGVPSLSSFEVTAKADDKNGGTNQAQPIALVVSQGKSRGTPELPRKPPDMLTLSVDISNLSEKRWLLKAQATTEGVVYRWTYNGKEYGRESVLVFDTSQIPTTPNQVNAEVTVWVENKQRAKASQIIHVPLDRSGNPSETKLGPKQPDTSL